MRGFFLGRRLLPLVLVAAVWPIGCSAIPAGAPLTMDELFPLEDGRVHAFKTLGPGGGPASITIQDVSKGHGYWSLDFWSSSSEHFSLAVVRDSTGVNISVIGIGHGAVPFDPPLLLVPPTVTEGVPWSSTGKIGTKMPEAQADLAKELARNPQMESLEFSTQGSTTSTETEVGGKSSRARSVEILVSAKNPKGQRVRAVWLRLWLAPGEGIVKAEFAQRSPENPPPMKSWELTEIKRKP